MLSLLKIIDNNGECNLDDLTNEYRFFYKYRLDNNLKVDRENCPYSDIEFLENNNKLKMSILQNPFEKFERKCFMYHSKDLNHIAFSNNLWQQILGDIDKIKSIFFTDLIKYYKELDGIDHLAELKKHWKC